MPKMPHRFKNLPRFRGPLGEDVHDALHAVRSARRFRLAGKGLSSTAAAALVSIPDSSYRWTPASRLIVGATIAVIGTIVWNVSSRGRSVRAATEKVGWLLGVEAKKNRGLREFLSQFKYVVVNRKGELQGTNRKRVLGIGRIRIPTELILRQEIRDPDYL